MKTFNESDILGHVPAMVGIQLLEYGKFCTVSNGPIEPRAEHQILGSTSLFPETLKPRCSPVYLGLAESPTEMERLDLLTSHDHGTVFRTIQETDAIYRICYRVGKRSEGGGGRYYTVATYLASMELLGPLAFYTAMPPLRGLTQNEAGALAPIIQGLTDQQQADETVHELANRVTYALHRGKTVHVKLPDEPRFFHVCDAVWKKLNKDQQRVFSCGWNVSPYLGARLLVSFGPKIPPPQLAVVLDPTKPAPQTSLRQSAQVSLDELFQDGQRFLRDAKATPDPEKGFLDMAVAALFSPFKQQFVARFPEILDSPKHHKAAIMHLISLKSAEQANLYANLELIVVQDDTKMDAWLEIRGHCRSNIADWGSQHESTRLKLAMQIHRATKQDTLPALLLKLSSEELAASAEFESKFQVLSNALNLLTMEQAALFHAKLLSQDLALPRWYEAWVNANRQKIASMLAEKRELKGLQRLGALYAGNDWKSLSLWEALASRRSSPDSFSGTLNRDEIEALIACLVKLWFWDFELTDAWLDKLGVSDEGGVLSHWLRKSIENTLADTKAEFANDVCARQRIVYRWRELCESGRIPEDLAEETWFDYCEGDAAPIKKLLNGWNTPLANRIRVYTACAEKLAYSAISAILLVQYNNALDRLSNRSYPQIRTILSSLLNDRKLISALELLLTAFPTCKLFDEWMSSNAAIIGALLLDKTDSDAWSGFIRVCPGILKELFDAIGTHNPPPALLEGKRENLNDQYGDLWLRDLGSYVERTWATLDVSETEWLHEWAKWIGPQFIADVGLRFLAGMHVELRDLVKYKRCASLLQSTSANGHLTPPLRLLSAVIHGEFQSEEEPQEADVLTAVVALKNNVGIAAAGLRWADLWKNATTPWQRLFILEAAPNQDFEVTASDLIAFKRYESRIDNLLSTGNTNRQRPSRLIRRLRLVNCPFGSFDHASDAWSKDLASTYLIGAFRNVPLDYYSDQLLEEVLDNYFPDLKRKGWAAGVASALTEFVNSYKSDPDNIHRVIEMVDRVFLRPQVYSNDEIRLRIFDSICIDHPSKHPTIEWDALQRQFLDAETPKSHIYVDETLHELIVLIAKSPGKEN